MGMSRLCRGRALREVSVNLLKTKKDLNSSAKLEKNFFAGQNSRKSMFFSSFFQDGKCWRGGGGLCQWIQMFLVLKSCWDILH
jgi:hypothetical protein